jgi:hypothetical protein
MTQTPTEFDPGSFRDRDGRVYRVLSAAATADWQVLSATRFFRRRRLPPDHRDS